MFRRWWAILLAVVVVSLLVVFIAIWMASSGSVSVSQQDDDDRIILSGEPPVVEFAPTAGSGDRQLDAFVRKFIQICLSGDYENFRLCWSAYSTPLSRQRFKATWYMVRKVRVERIYPAPKDVEAMRPAYIVEAHVWLNRRAKVPEKRVYVLIQREGDRWAVAPAPRQESPAQSQPEKVMIKR